MKLPLLLLLALVLSSSASGPPLVRVTFKTIDQAAYEAARKTKVVTTPRIIFPLRKQQGRIVIPTAKGNVIYRDRWLGTDRDDMTEFRYEGFLPAFNCHVVVGRFYEWSQWFLVSENGTQVALYNAPQYSPTQAAFVSVSQGIEYGVYPNIIRLFRFKNGSWQEGGRWSRRAGSQRK